MTRFTFTLPRDAVAPTAEQAELDKDGDIVVVRKTQQCVLFIGEGPLIEMDTVEPGHWAAKDYRV